MWPVSNEVASIDSILHIDGSAAAAGREALCKVIRLDGTPLSADHTASVFFALSPDESTLAVAINSRFCVIPVASAETASAPFTFVDDGVDAATQLNFSAAPAVIHDLAWSPSTPPKLLVAYAARNCCASVRGPEDPAPPDPRASQLRLFLSLYTSVGAKEGSPISAFSVAQKVAAVCWYTDPGRNPPVVVAALSDTSCYLLETEGAARNGQILQPHVLVTDEDDEDGETAQIEYAHARLL